uniref:Uncharacterized protein n=1 Tax=Bracon brevicornis TaxID=1563983 RepID=A0A6V7IHL9_9HYME
MLTSGIIPGLLANEPEDIPPLVIQPAPVARGVQAMPIVEPLAEQQTLIAGREQAMPIAEPVAVLEPPPNKLIIAPEGGYWQYSKYKWQELHI